MHHPERAVAVAEAESAAAAREAQRTAGRGEAQRRAAAPAHGAHRPSAPYDPAYGAQRPSSSYDSASRSPSARVPEEEPVQDYVAQIYRDDDRNQQGKR